MKKALRDDKRISHINGSQKHVNQSCILITQRVLSSQIAMKSLEDSRNRFNIQRVVL